MLYEVITHYAVSVIILGLVLSAIIYLIELKSKEALRLSILSSYSKFTLVGVSLGFLAFFSGVYISLTGLAGACSGWPLCETGEFPRELSGWIVYIHRIVVALVGAYLLWFSQQSWRKQRSQPTILTVSNLFVVLFVARITSYNVCYTKLLRDPGAARSIRNQRPETGRSVDGHHQLLYNVLCCG